MHPHSAHCVSSCEGAQRGVLATRAFLTAHVNPGSNCAQARMGWTRACVHTADLPLFARIQTASLLAVACVVQGGGGMRRRRMPVTPDPDPAGMALRIEGLQLPVQRAGAYDDDDDLPQGQPGTVQDQSTCALLLPHSASGAGRAQRQPYRVSPDAPQPTGPGPGDGDVGFGATHSSHSAGQATVLVPLSSWRRVGPGSVQVLRDAQPEGPHSRVAAAEPDIWQWLQSLDAEASTSGTEAFGRSLSLAAARAPHPADGCAPRLPTAAANSPDPGTQQLQAVGSGAALPGLVSPSRTPPASVGTGSSKRLTRAIMACRHWRQLAALAQERSSSGCGPPNALHLGAFLSRLSRFLPNPKPGGQEAADLLAFMGYLESMAGAQLEASCEQPLPASWARHVEQQQQTPQQQQLGRSSVGMGPRQVASVIGALARLKYLRRPPAKLVHLAAAVAWPRLLHYAPAELTQLLWALATLRHRPGPDWMHQACRAALARAREYTPRELSTVLWALASLKYSPGRAWTSRWLGQVGVQMQAMSAYDLSQTLWALAALRVPREALPEGWADTALARAAEVLRPGACRPQDVCNALCAMAALRLRPRPMLLSDAFNAAAIDSAALARCRPIDLAHLLWAAAALHYRPWPNTMRGILQGLRDAAHKLTAQDVGQALWALGSMQYQPQRAAMHAMLSRLLALLPAAAGDVGREAAALPQALAMAVWAMAKLRMRPRPQLIGCLMDAAQRLAPHFSPQVS